MEYEPVVKSILEYLTQDPHDARMSLWERNSPSANQIRNSPMVTSILETLPENDREKAFQGGIDYLLEQGRLIPSTIINGHYQRGPGLQEYVWNQQTKKVVQERIDALK